MTRSHVLGQRQPMLDIARFLGMICVFYAYIAEQFMILGDSSARLTYQGLSSFVLSFFIILAGYVAPPTIMELSPKVFGARIVRLRLFPYAVLSLILLVLSVLFTGAYGQSSIQGYMYGIFATVCGRPVFNVPIWFLALLVATECFHYCVGRLLTTTTRLLVVMIVFYCEGYWFNAAIQFIFQTYHWNVNFWFLSVVPMMYSFYLFGILLRQKGYLDKYMSPRNIGIAMGACFLGLVLLAGWNAEPWQLLPGVMFLAGGTSNIIVVALSALLGSAFLFLGAKLWETCPWAEWMGRHALILLGCNGLFYHYIYPPLAKWSIESLGTSWWTTAIVCLLATVLSFAVTIPVSYGLTRVFSKHVPSYVMPPVS